MGVSSQFDKAQKKAEGVGLESPSAVCSPLKCDERLDGDKPSIQTLRNLSLCIHRFPTHTHTPSVSPGPSELCAVEGLSADSSSLLLRLPVPVPRFFFYGFTNTGPGLIKLWKSCQSHWTGGEYKDAQAIYRVMDIAILNAFTWVLLDVLKQSGSSHTHTPVGFLLQ